MTIRKTLGMVAVLAVCVLTMNLESEVFAQANKSKSKVSELKRQKPNLANGVFQCEINKQDLAQKLFEDITKDIQENGTKKAIENLQKSLGIPEIKLKSDLTVKIEGKIKVTDVIFLRRQNKIIFEFKVREIKSNFNRAMNEIQILECELTLTLQDGMMTTPFSQPIEVEIINDGD